MLQGGDFTRGNVSIILVSSTARRGIDCSRVLVAVPSTARSSPMRTSTSSTPSLVSSPWLTLVLTREFSIPLVLVRPCPCSEEFVLMVS